MLSYSRILYDQSTLEWIAPSSCLFPIVDAVSVPNPRQCAHTAVLQTRQAARPRHEGRIHAYSLTAA